jgi:hypothetical protein
MRDVLLLLLTNGLRKIMIDVVFPSGNKAKSGFMADGACHLFAGNDHGKNARMVERR